MRDAECLSLFSNRKTRQSSNCLLHGDKDLTDRLPTLFLPHGGGPCFFMDWGPAYPSDMWESMAVFLRSAGSGIGRLPKAVVVISGHWETAVPTVMSVERNTLLFDYMGFPKHTYELTYPAAGSPEVAERVQALLGEAGFACEVERERGLDHGVFIPFLLIYPDADVPMLQLSLPRELDADGLIAMGRALAPLRQEDVLIVGSGMSYHNIPGILGRIPGQAGPSAAFDDWLGSVMAIADQQEREHALKAWQGAPFASTCHPTPEHFLPLLVVAGAGDGAAGKRIYNAPTLGNPQSAFCFGDWRLNGRMEGTDGVADAAEHCP
ncbi:DODA-type extradiol aromatic ring-opening family dioxygenase [Novosphingobium album (ex Hu et al. 2023)]|uniref:Dioxygenase n=1 Tax=Novosphingobium album (ex Hu et al. 2023) TaxID=2930093 RepID=A0ABT0B541_9SPHN|nr:class III extradiol ring-cleavage dioxygenase [Novosphingobium album (ex Hu et al. 2023)]MCJ2179988.1 dioxygenase [Novosphingobium album (ex Hu et al. 2023)]